MVGHRTGNPLVAADRGLRPCYGPRTWGHLDTGSHGHTGSIMYEPRRSCKLQPGSLSYFTSYECLGFKAKQSTNHPINEQLSDCSLMALTQMPRELMASETHSAERHAVPSPVTGELVRMAGPSVAEATPLPGLTQPLRTQSRVVQPRPGPRAHPLSPDERPRPLLHPALPCAPSSRFRVSTCRPGHTATEATRTQSPMQACGGQGSVPAALSSGARSLLLHHRPSLHSRHEPPLGFPQPPGRGAWVQLAGSDRSTKGWGRPTVAPQARALGAPACLPAHLGPSQGTDPCPSHAGGLPAARLTSNPLPLPR